MCILNLKFYTYEQIGYRAEIEAHKLFELKKIEHDSQKRFLLFQNSNKENRLQDIPRKIICVT